jgi:hypothetical protein
VKTRYLSLLLLGAVLGGPAFALIPATDQYVPSVAHAAGQVVNGVRAAWRADVWIFNPGDAAAQVDVYYLVRGQANPSPESRRVTVNAGETRYFPDVLLSQFGHDDATGALRVVSTLPVVVTGRSFDANVTVDAKQRGAGTAGQFFSGVPASSAITLGQLVDITGLDQDAEGTAGTWRSNLALVETSGTPVTLDVQRLDADGTAVGSIPVTLLGREPYQLDLILWSIAAAPGSNQRVRVTVTGGTGKVVASASRIDNRTGDPSTVEMAGQGLDGEYVCRVDKTNYDMPMSLIVSGNAIAHLETTVLFTDEDAGAGCTGGELLHIDQDLVPAPVLDDGEFSFQVSGTAGGLTVTLQLDGRIATSTRLSGTVTTTLAGAGSCSGTRAWPLQGARLP